MPDANLTAPAHEVADKVRLLHDVLACSEPAALAALIREHFGAELVIILDEETPGRAGDNGVADGVTGPRTGGAVDGTPLQVGRFRLDVPAEQREQRRFLELLLRAGHLTTIGELPPRHGDELLRHAVRVITSNVLLVLDRQDVLTSIANSVLHLLDADICGVLLLDGDELAMRACAGQRTLETQRLRMRAGQGLAGRVLRTGEACWVDDYVSSDKISGDFVPLALAEGAQTALGVPLRSRDELVGVLEVWRRRPARFDRGAVQLMTMIADMVSIAIDNSHLYEVQRDALDELQATEKRLSAQLERMRSSAQLQRDIMDVLIDDAADVDISWMIGNALDCEALFLGPDGRVLAHWAPGATTDGLVELVSELSLSPGRVVRTDLPDASDRSAWAQLVQAGSPEPLGVVAVVGPRDQASEMSLGLGQMAGFVALQRLAERAATEARTQARDDLLWELIDDDPQRRAAAVDQARRWGIDLSPDHRLLVGRLDDYEAALRERGWSVADLDGARRELNRGVHRIVSRHQGQFGVMRGHRVVLVVKDGHEFDVADDLTTVIGDILPGIACWWGVSSRWTDQHALHRSYAEARTAQRAARRTASRRPLAHDDLGLVGLLVSDPDGPELANFVRTVLGPVIAYDATSDDWTLIETLEAYFRHDCSQKEAAAAIPIHHKTMRYRLDRIEELANLDMRSHSDRQRASLAIEVLRVVGNGRVADGAATLAGGSGQTPSPSRHATAP